MTTSIIQLSDQELLDCIQQLNLSQKQISQRLRRGYSIPEISELIFRTQFLDSNFNGTVPIMARMYCLKHGLTSIPKCQNPKCNNDVEWRNGKNEFSTYCCHRCAISDPNYWNRVHNTMNEKYGGVGMASNELKKRIQNTNLVRYGSISAFGNELVRVKSKLTCKKRYGVEYSIQSKEVKSKIRDTLVERYGVDHYSKCSQFKEKTSRTWSQKSEQELLEIQQRTENTNLKRYGVKNVFQSREIQERIKQTILANLGVENPMQSEQVKSKFKETMNSKYGGIGFQSSFILERIQSTMLLKYGCTHTSKSDAILRKISASLRTQESQERMKQTFLKKYGVEYYSQTYEYHKIKRHRFESMKYPGQTFDSSWEVKLYEYCKDNQLEIEYSPKISFKYEYNGNTHTYHPDFLINGRLYEIKGDHFFNGSGQMVNPYDHSQDGKYEAKHQCMLSNGITILRRDDLTIWSV